MRTVLAGLAGALTLAGILVTDVAAQRRDGDDAKLQDRDDGKRDLDDARRRDRGWVLLGKKEVGFRVDRDVISIDQSEDWHKDRSFKSLHFVAEGNEVHLMSVRLVYFKNALAEDLRVDRLIRRGDELALDLRGERSYLRRIEITYRSRPAFTGRAVLKVYGEPARRGPPGPVSGSDWVELGCQQVSLFGKDRDSIGVGRREGRFKAIRLLVRGADVEVLDLKVVYEPDDIRVKSLIRAGDRTRPLDLRGGERAIERIDLTYRTKLNPKDVIDKQRIRMATVCVEGLQ